MNTSTQRHPHSYRKGQHKQQSTYQDHDRIAISVSVGHSSSKRRGTPCRGTRQTPGQKQGSGIESGPSTFSSTNNTIILPSIPAEADTDAFRRNRRGAAGRERPKRKFAASYRDIEMERYIGISSIFPSHVNQPDIFLSRRGIAGAPPRRVQSISSVFGEIAESDLPDMSVGP